jgi:hypothetical protein
MITKIVNLFAKKKPTFFEKAKSTAASYSATAKAKGMDAMGKIQKSKIYTEASNSIGELKAPLKKYGNIASKHLSKHSNKYAAGAIGVAGVGVYNQHQKLKKDGTHARLQKELKRKGYL